LSPRRGLAGFLTVASTPLVILLSLFLGRYPLPPGRVLDCLAYALHLSHSPGEAALAIVLLYRAPRVVAAAVTGVALSVSGAALQSMLRNPLVDTYILSIAAGAGFGAALALAFLPPGFPVELLAFAMALAAFFTVLAIAWGWGGGSIIALVLSGVIVNAFFSAMLSLVKYFAPNPHKLASIVYWLMGDIGQAAYWPIVARMLALTLPATLILLALRWRLNLLSLGDEEAMALGVNPARERLIVAVLCALLAAAVTSYTGIIGWVGLIVPHIVRLATGSDNRRVILYSVFAGATYMVLADDLARTLLPEELPIGVLTTLMGAPLFIYLLRRAGRVWR